MYVIPAAIAQRLLLAHLTPARLTELFKALVDAMNKQGLDDAALELEYSLPGEVYGPNDLLPSITIGLRKAHQIPRLELPHEDEEEKEFCPVAYRRPHEAEDNCGPQILLPGDPGSD